MGSLIKIVLVFIVLLLCIPLMVRLLAWMLLRRLRGALAGMVPAVTPAPARLHLEPIEGPPFTDESSAAALHAFMAEHGLDGVGAFEVGGQAGFRLEAFCDPARDYWGVVYEHPQVGQWIDLVVRYEDGGSLTATNAAIGGQLDRRPGHDKIWRKSADPAALWDEFEAAIGDCPRKPAEATQFAAMFEQAYADEMDWRNSRGGPTADEIRRVSAERGYDYDASAEEMTRLLLAAEAAEQLHAVLTEALREQSGLTVDEWEEASESIVTVHSRRSPAEMAEDLLTAAGNACDWNGEQEPVVEACEPLADDEEPAGEAWSEAFAQMLGYLPASFQAVKLAEVDSPLPAQAWRVCTTG